MFKLEVGSSTITIPDIYDVVKKKKLVELPTNSSYRKRIQENARFLQESILQNQAIYGTTTGFGASCQQYLDASKATQLQRNLIKYHQCATGEYLTFDQTIAIMTARLQSIAQGYSGVSHELLETLCQMINARIAPCIPAEGSVGASGDLTPLAYIAAALEGSAPKVRWNGETMSSAQALAANNITPISFQPKEGLAIINGTSVMAGINALACAKARKLVQTMEILTALAVQILKGKREAFDHRIHQVKPFVGQKKAAQRIFELLEGSQLTQKPGKQAQKFITEKKQESHSFRLPFAVQDVYSLRCAPHAIGVFWDTLEMAEQWTETEINSVTDNPLIFHEDKAILLGGNFYGGHIAQAADSLKIALANLTDLADRQLALIVDEKFSQGLPANLAIPVPEEEGLHHGFKGMQITSSALTAETLKNSAPASIFSRVTESCNQDKVSMGTIAARDLDRSVQMSSRVLSILSLAVAQAVDILGEEKISPATQVFYQEIRKLSTVLREDRPMGDEIEKVAQYITGETL